MTTSPTPAELLALKTANAALDSRDASYDLVSTIVFALGSAGLLMDPEKAKRFAELEADRVATEQALTIERDNPAAAFTHDCGIPLARRLDCGHCPHEICQDCDRCPHTCRCAEAPESLHASSGAVIPVPDDVRPQVAKLRALLAGQREEPHDSPLHHTYAVPRDFPESGVRP